MRILLAILLIGWSLTASAQNQPVYQSGGNVTLGHAAMWQQNGAISDAGGAAGSAILGSGYLTEIGITNTGTPFCINDALTNAVGGYHQFCFGANALGGGLISYNAYGDASALPLYFNLNGEVIEFPGTGNGNVVGPVSTTINEPAVWANTSGTLLKDGLNAPISHTGTLHVSGATTLDSTLGVGGALSVTGATSLAATASPVVVTGTGGGTSFQVTGALGGGNILSQVYNSGNFASTSTAAGTQYVIGGSAQGVGSVGASVGSGGPVMELLAGSGLSAGILVSASVGPIVLNAPGGILLQGISATSGTDILCYSSGTFAVTYATAVVGCVPSALRFKNLIAFLDPHDALHGVMALRPAVWTYKDTKRYGAQPYEGVLADDVCKMDQRLCHHDANGIDNYDKVGALGYAIAAIQELKHEVDLLKAERRRMPR